MKGAAGLTVDNVRELSSHLAEVIPSEHLAGAVAAIVAMADFMAHDTGPSRNRRTRIARAAHLRKVAESAATLARLLRCGQPSLYAVNGRVVDYAGLDGTLEQIAESARGEAWVMQPSAKAHRPPDEARDVLIATVYSVYPADEAKKAVGSHFETTVEMVLGFLGRDVEDVHGLILRSLRRKPEPPWLVFDGRSAWGRM
ncbi:MAG TPA: hypothetical protein VMX54_15665 [Vicinamibacteria bacterium]|nr:hypothetical protein [Vicinamibacteria bacterium]